MHVTASVVSESIIEPGVMKPWEGVPFLIVGPYIDMITNFSVVQIFLGESV